MAVTLVRLAIMIFSSFTNVLFLGSTKTVGFFPPGHQIHVPASFFVAARPAPGQIPPPEYGVMRAMMDTDTRDVPREQDDFRSPRSCCPYVGCQMGKSAEPRPWRMGRTSVFRSPSSLISEPNTKRPDRIRRAAGSVFWPLLFLLYLNGIESVSLTPDIIIYVHDTWLKYLSSWLNTNHLQLNTQNS